MNYAERLNKYAGGQRNMTRKATQLLEAYTISGIERKELNNAQKCFVDTIFTNIIRKCNQDDNSIGCMADALKEVSDVIRDDPLFRS